ncbi:ABC transporter permease [Microlunatus soli]|uniref:ABC-2 family transporter protein n=1 Tax=Microlunatus soli TaxID=630515 RepID=A0A1H1SWV9_9ACTN|nr:ABC transporter permease [Microlunatus soli]SDS51889.1 ABC-2 family transporter protein [Microlunatus soli]
MTTISHAPTAVRHAGHAELIKLRSVRFNGWAVLGAVLLTIAFAVIVASSIAASAANGYDITASSAGIAADAIILGQLPVLMIGILLTTQEYGSGAIRLTLRSTPLRGQLLLARALVVGILSFVLGGLLATVGMITASWMIGEVDVASTADRLRTVLGTGGYLALTGLLIIGLGTVLRSTIVTILVTLLLLLAGPVLTQVSSADWLHTAQLYLPGTAGSVLMAPDGGDYGTGTALLILGCWAAVGQLVGYLALWLRDA